MRTNARTSVRTKLKEVTFCLGDKPMQSLMWCDRVPKAKRTKPAKIMGIQYQEINGGVEHSYYVPID